MNDFKNFIPDYRYAVLAPQILLAVLALAVLVVGLFTDRNRKSKLEHYLPPDYLAVCGLVAVLAWQSSMLWRSLKAGEVVQAVKLFPTSPGDPLSPSLMVMDRFAMFFSLIAIGGSVLVGLLSIDYFRKRDFNRGEYYSLLIFATLAITLVAASTDLITIYLSLEFLSLCSYVLAAYLKGDRKSSEAGLKYFLFGAVASAVMLYGMSMLYGVTGSTALSAIFEGLRTAPGDLAATAWLAVVLVLAGLGFKLALVPFHLWAPDTYEGAPTPITAFLSVCSKAAGFAVIVRVLDIGVPLPQNGLGGVDWFSVVAALAAITMTLGNLVAISQRNIKRMLAYSSIAQVGYILIGLLAATKSSMGMPGLMIYVFGYLFMNLGAFTVVIGLSDKTGSDEIESYAGLMSRSPLYAVTLTLFLLSLAGIPPTVGFLGKFYVFGSAIEYGQKLWPLVALALANSVISVYYYFNVVRQMFFMPAASKDRISPSSAIAVALLVSLAGILVFGIYPQPLIDLARWCSVVF
ncbi:MAG: NADH-quinone oxidoreductase subunit N [Armatimonadota bacterium]|nr:NADH-quinone oxidoreductase subunit N [Armatimonadota bacterium]